MDYCSIVDVTSWSFESLQYVYLKALSPGIASQCGSLVLNRLPTRTRLASWGLRFQLPAVFARSMKKIETIFSSLVITARRYGNYLLGDQTLRTQTLTLGQNSSSGLDVLQIRPFSVKEACCAMYHLRIYHPLTGALHYY